MHRTKTKRKRLENRSKKGKMSKKPKQNKSFNVITFKVVTKNYFDPGSNCHSSRRALKQNHFRPTRPQSPSCRHPPRGGRRVSENGEQPGCLRRKHTPWVERDRPDQDRKPMGYRVSMRMKSTTNSRTEKAAERRRAPGLLSTGYKGKGKQGDKTRGNRGIEMNTPCAVAL